MRAMGYSRNGVMRKLPITSTSGTHQCFFDDSDVASKQPSESSQIFTIGKNSWIILYVTRQINPDSIIERLCLELGRCRGIRSAARTVAVWRQRLKSHIIKGCDRRC